MRNPPSEQLTLFVAGSLDHANHSVKPGSAEARTMTVTSGRKCLESLKSASPLGLLERMLLGSSIWSSTARFLTWKAKTTKSGYSYWVLSPSKPRIKDNDAGSSEEKEIFLTPNVMDSLPPRSKEALQKQYEKNRKGRTTHSTLREQVAYPEPNKMWPTPNAGLEKHSDKNEYWENRIKKGRQTDIQMEVYKQTGSGQLNAEWVTWLMGYPPWYLKLDPYGT